MSSATRRCFTCPLWLEDVFLVFYRKYTFTNILDIRNLLQVCWKKEALKAFLWLEVWSRSRRFFISPQDFLKYKIFWKPSMNKIFFTDVLQQEDILQVNYEYEMLFWSSMSRISLQVFWTWKNNCTEFLEEGNLFELIWRFSITRNILYISSE